jgi:hypothetical protein
VIRSSFASRCLVALPLLGLVGSGCQGLLGLDQYTKDPEQLGGEGGDGPGSGGRSSGGRTGSGGSSDEVCTKKSECDDENDCTSDDCESNKCVHDPVPGGNPCEGGVCNGVRGAEKCQACIDDQPGSDTDSGCSTTTPQCRLAGTPECVGCSRHEDCDDNNDCTTDACRTDGTCKYTPRGAGSTCDNGGDGVCDGTASKEACAICLDDKPSTDKDTGCTTSKPICGENGCSKCQDSGEGVDLGCSEAKPNCDEPSGLCTNECTTVECDTEDGCKTVPNDDLCAAGDTCPGRCDADLGCIEGTLTTESVIWDNSFEDIAEDESSWQAYQENVLTDKYELIDIENAVVASATAYDGNYVARLPSGANLNYDLSQSFVLAPNVLKVTFKGYYRSVSEDATADAEDYLHGSLYNYDTDVDAFISPFLATDTNADYRVEPITNGSVNNGWTYFEYDVTDFSSFPEDYPPELNFIGNANDTDPLILYEIDSVDVIQTYCE